MGFLQPGGKILSPVSGYETKMPEAEMRWAGLCPPALISSIHQNVSQMLEEKKPMG